MCVCEASWDNLKSKETKSNWKIRLQRFQQEKNPFRPRVGQVLTTIYTSFWVQFEKRCCMPVRVPQALIHPFLFCSLDQTVIKFLITFNILRSYKKISDIISLRSFCGIHSLSCLPEDSSCLYPPPHNGDLYEHIQWEQLPLSWKS